MSKRKSINAKIFNLENDEFLSDITLTIILITPSDPNDYPNYQVFGRIDKTCVEYSDKNLMLEITPSLRDKAFFTMFGPPGLYTEFRITLEEPSWQNPEWFDNL